MAQNARGKIEKRPPREVDEHLIIGTRANVETTKVMVDYLVNAIERLAAESGFTGTRDLHAFKLGAARRLEVRLDLLHDKNMRAKRRRQSAPSTLPVLADGPPTPSFTLRFMACVWRAGAAAISGQTARALTHAGRPRAAA